MVSEREATATLSVARTVIVTVSPMLATSVLSRIETTGAAVSAVTVSV